MTKIAYIEHPFRRSSLQLIERINGIIAEYERKGYSLTLRQVYYQLVSRDVIPNNEKSYKNLGELISNGRLAGLISWKSIEDRTRNLKGNSHWETPGSIIDSAAYSYALDKWKGQDYYVEVWVEKDALVGVVGRACGSLDINFFSCRGYVSQSEMWEASQRMHRLPYKVKPVILHLGDHDPSGIDMSRDIQERLELFGATPVFERLALNMDQIEEYAPPPNPAKMSDSRANGYVDRYGEDSWELDALRPEVIDKLIQDNVKKYMDVPKFNAVVMQQEKERELLKRVARNWDTIAARYGGDDDGPEYDPENDPDYENEE